MLSIVTAAVAPAQERPAPSPAPGVRTADDVWILQMQNPAREYAVRARFFREDEAEPVVQGPEGLPRQLAAAGKPVAQAGGTGAAASRDARLTKDYPVTTRSAWAEFKLGSESEVHALHRQLMQMWTGRKRDG